MSAIRGAPAVERLEAGRPGSPGDRPTVANRLSSVTLWYLLPLALTLFTVFGFGRGRVHLAGDFHYWFWPAGQQVLHGLSPYVDSGSTAVTHGVPFPYPALAALLFAPFALIPHGAADVIFVGLNIAAALLTLCVLGVRDRRLYGLVMLCPAVYSGWTVANVTLLLALAVATIWRYREHAFLIGLLVALLISVKLLLWPLLLWLLATRRYAALAYAAVCVLILNVTAWGVLGFHELARYSEVLNSHVVAQEVNGYSLVGLAQRAGLGHVGAYALALGAASAVAISCMVMGRRGRDVPALALAIGVSLLATPIVQLHYFALLLIPLSLARPRLCFAWALPLAVWVCASAAPRPWEVAVALALGAAMVAIAVLRDPTGAIVSCVPDGPTKRLDLRLAPPSGSSVATGHLGR